MNYDLIIKNGRIIDGTGNPWSFADIGIAKGKIKNISTKINTKLDDTKIIEANGLTISPGFIDVHSHADSSLLFDYKLECLAQQGITTIVVGNSGMSFAPLNPENTLYPSLDTSAYTNSPHPLLPQIY